MVFKKLKMLSRNSGIIDYRVATLSVLLLTNTGIIMQSMKSEG